MIQSLTSPTLYLWNQAVNTQTFWYMLHIQSMPFVVFEWCRDGIVFHINYGSSTFWRKSWELWKLLIQEMPFSLEVWRTQSSPSSWFFPAASLAQPTERCSRHSIRTECLTKIQTAGCLRWATLPSLGRWLVGLGGIILVFKVSGVYLIFRTFWKSPYNLLFIRFFLFSHGVRHKDRSIYNYGLNLDSRVSVWKMLSTKKVCWAGRKKDGLWVKTGFPPSDAHWPSWKHRCDIRQKSLSQGEWRCLTEMQLGTASAVDKLSYPKLDS